MKTTTGAVCALLWMQSDSHAEMTFRDYGEYCQVASEGSTSTLRARISGMSKTRISERITKLTDPIAIRMAHEVIEFAYSRPADMSIETMRAELKPLCLERKLFVK